MIQNPQNVSPMSNEGRNSYVISHITDALLALLKDKPLGEISVSELCGSAGVGRASFYRNFESKEDILRCHIEKIFYEWLEWYESNSKILLSAQIGELFSHFEKHREFYSILNDRGLIFLLKDVIIKSFMKTSDGAKAEVYARAFVAYSLYGWVEVWFQRGMRESAAEMEELFKNQGL